MKNKYSELKNKHQKEFDSFPMFFAFNKKQFEQGMRKIGLEPNEKSKICKFPGGGYLKKTDAKSLKELIDHREKEISDAIENDKTGEGFIFDMLTYELSNHEYVITGSTEDALDTLGLTQENVDKNPLLQKGLELAKADQWGNE